MNHVNLLAFRGYAAASGEEVAPDFSVSTRSDVERACAAAEFAFDAYRALPSERRAAFLEAIGEEIMNIGDALLERAHLESGLPMARLTGERGRTVAQLKLFAQVVRADRWRGIRIDPAMPDRQPLPRPDLRLRKIPLGPVAVFGASNFPLAFSTAGGDTASALAAGCPVVVKGHPAHPGTDTMVAEAVLRAAERTDMPAGVFGHVRGPGNDLGEALVRDPRIAAVGFTGSRSGGLALVRIARERDVPIPVYAEMSSVNPVILMPGALKARAHDLGKAFVGSLAMGAGQFCTSPGLVLAVECDDLAAFEAAAKEALTGQAAQTMLTSGIRDAYAKGTAKLTGAEGWSSSRAARPATARPAMPRSSSPFPRTRRSPTAMCWRRCSARRHSSFAARIWRSSRKSCAISRASSRQRFTWTIAITPRRRSWSRFSSEPPAGCWSTVGRRASRWRTRWFMAAHIRRHRTAGLPRSARLRSSVSFGQCAIRTCPPSYCRPN